MQMKTPFAIALVGSLLLSLGPVAEAETAEVKVPKQGWSIFFDSPPLTNKRDSKKGGDYAFMAGSGRFNVSLYVEKPHGSGDTHKACYEFYWPKGSQNPMIAKDTVTMSEGQSFVRVQYDILAPFEGGQIRQRNVNYYFAFRDRWIDVHISVIKPTADDDALFAAFDKSLRYGS